jgi:hypothetical protein
MRPAGPLSPQQAAELLEHGSGVSAKAWIVPIPMTGECRQRPCRGWIVRPPWPGIGTPRKTVVMLKTGITTVSPPPPKSIWRRAALPPC